MKIKIMKSDKKEEEIFNVKAVIYDLPDKCVKVIYHENLGTIYIGKIKELLLSLDDVLAFIVEGD